MKKTILLFGAPALLTLAVLATACGGGAPAAVPTSVPPAPAIQATATPVSATATAVPPTAVPPTATTVPPTTVPTTSAPAATAAPTSGSVGSPGGGAPGSLADAVKKSQTATAFRMDMKMSGKGDFGGLAAGADPNQELDLIVINGEVNGKDTHFLLKGFFAAFVGADPATGIEVISVEGKTYIHGPVPLLGATEDKWYQADQAQTDLGKPPVSPSDFMNAFAGKDSDLSGLKKSGSESLDGAQCDVYVGDKATTLQAMQGLGSSPIPKEDADAIETAESKFWVCGDGYLHQITLNAAGHDKAKPDQKQSFSLRVHVSDLNGKITITPPSGAVPLPASPFSTPTP